jgi:cell division protein FtsW
VVRHGDVRRRAGSVLLAQDQRFQLGASRFKVDAVDAGGLAMSAGAAQWRYDGATLLRGGLPQPDCPDTRLAARIVGGWNRLLPSSLGIPRPLVFGGNLDCGNRIAIAGIPAPAATLKRSADGMLLSGGQGVQAAPLLLHTGAAEDGVLLAEREEALSGAGACRWAARPAPRAQRRPAAFAAGLARRPLPRSPAAPAGRRQLVVDAARSLAFAA